MTKTTDMTCPKCGKKYQSKGMVLLRCKDCKKWLEYDQVIPAAKTFTEEKVEGVQQASISKERVIATPHQELVAAQNRTTRAVRALAVFLFSSLRSGLVGSGFAGLGFLTLSSSAQTGIFLIVIGWLITFVGFFVAFFKGSSELQKSNIPSERN
jgi:hypothetical protein